MSLDREANLKPYLFKKGVSGNPSGRPKGTNTKVFQLALRKFFFDIPLKDKQGLLNEALKSGRPAQRFQTLFRVYYDKALELIPKCSNIGQLIAFMPFLIYVRDTIDGREETSKEEIKEASTVFLSASGIKKQVKTLTASRVVSAKTWQEEPHEPDNGLRPGPTE